MHQTIIRTAARLHARRIATTAAAAVAPFFQARLPLPASRLAQRPAFAFAARRYSNSQSHGYLHSQRCASIAAALDARLRASVQVRRVACRGRGTGLEQTTRGRGNKQDAQRGTHAFGRFGVHRIVRV
jgi:hypothetical protein